MQCKYNLQIPTFFTNVTMPITFKVTDTAAEPIRHVQPFTIRDALTILYDKHQIVENKTHTLIRSNIQETENNVKLAGNSFVHAAFNAYNNHHNLVISPDDVWLAIMTQFSFYINANAETLRSKLVDFQGKKQLVVLGGGNLFTADYEKLCMDMTGQIAENIKDPTVREWIMPDFSTTTFNEKLVGAIVLMASMKKYFEYKFSLLCNLPSVTLLGEVEDWIKIRERAERLVEYDTKKRYMARWSEMLLPILDQFVTAAQGNPDILFWNRIAHQKGGGSGPRYLSGWITSFCHFTALGKWMGDRKTVQDMEGEIKGEWLLIDTNDIPAGHVTCPVVVDDNGVQHDTEFIAGHLYAVKKDQVTIAPAVGWTLWKVDKSKIEPVEESKKSQGCLLA